MATAGQRAVLIVGVASGLGFGSYYFSQLQEVQKYEKDKKDIERLVDTEGKKLATTTKAEAEQEQLVSEVDSQVRERQKVVQDLEIKLDAAHKQVQQLEQQLKSKNADLKSKQSDLVAAKSRLIDLRAEAERSKQSFTMGERSLLLTNQKIAEAKLLTNPLNHPKVRSLLGKDK